MTLLKAAIVIGLCAVPLALFWLIWVALPFQHRSNRRGGREIGE